MVEYYITKTPTIKVDGTIIGAGASALEEADDDLCRVT